MITTRRYDELQYRCGHASRIEEVRVTDWECGAGMDGSYAPKHKNDEARRDGVLNSRLEVTTDIACVAIRI